MDTSDDSHYVYLDFSEKLTPSIFANNLFLRIANLHKPNPLVQVNDLLFKGSYDECVGTNIFFEETKDPPTQTNIFEKNSPIHLKPILTQTKLIKLKQVKLPRYTPQNKQCRESVVLNLTQDYKVLLEKLEQGVLNIDDLAQKTVEQNLEEQFEEMTFDSEEILTEPERELDTVLDKIDNPSTSAMLEAKYERLKRLVRRPVKRMKSPELIQECEPQYRNAYEYHNLERQVCQNSDAFRTVTCPIIEKSFVGGVDLDRCVLQGLLPPFTDLNHSLTKEQQRKIFTIDNFENLSLPARYLVLKECVSQIEDLIENTSAEELKEVDEHGRTIADICDIFRRLLRALEQCMSQGVDSEDGASSRTDLSDRPYEDYIKYKYSPSLELLIPSKEIFNDEEWTDEDKGTEKTEDSHGSSNDSLDEDSDLN